MAVDLLYVAANRLDYTRQSFEALLANTDWTLVNCLYVADDESVDGTAEYLQEALQRSPVTVRFNPGKFGGPVAAMNWFLDYPEDTCASCNGSGGSGAVDEEGVPQPCRACGGTGYVRHPDVFGKVDNDFVVCPGWLNVLVDTLALHPEIDVLGVEPWEFGPPVMPVAGGPYARQVSAPVEHVGGKGLIRRRIFSRCRPQPGGFNGYQGWSQYQAFHPDVVKAWIVPDLPCFGLDQTRDEDFGGRWRDLAYAYEANGWQRMWGAYGDSKHYAWWAPV